MMKEGRMGRNRQGQMLILIQLCGICDSPCFPHTFSLTATNLKGSYCDSILQIGKSRHMNFRDMFTGCSNRI